ncbi:MAG: phytanoyl-CoA dioxygenase family protein [Pirellulales bacterium]
MAEDLSQYDAPISQFIQRPNSRDQWREYRLSDEQVDFFHENGYVAGIRVLDDRQIEQLRSELANLIDPSYQGNSLFHEFHSNESPDPSRVLFHALGAWRIAPGFHDVIFSPAFCVPASQLLDGPVRFWHDQLFCKPARHGGVVAWHQDYSYWKRTQPMQHITCWIGLDDATRDNGCLQYIPGSHRWDLLPITGLAGDMEAIREVLSEEQFARLQQPVAIELKAGEASFHHPLMIHGSQANSTDRQRRATVINAFRDGTRSASDEPMQTGIPPVPEGQPMQGRFFPLLYDPSRAE